MEEIDPENIIGGRTRGKIIDWNEAEQKAKEAGDDLGDDDDDDDDDEDFVDPDDEMKEWEAASWLSWTTYIRSKNSSCQLPHWSWPLLFCVGHSTQGIGQDTSFEYVVYLTQKYLQNRGWHGFYGWRS